MSRLSAPDVLPAFKEPGAVFWHYTNLGYSHGAAYVMMRQWLRKNVVDTPETCI